MTIFPDVRERKFGACCRAIVRFLREREKLLEVGFVLLMLCFLLLPWRSSEARQSPEPKHRAAVACDLLEGATRGRQGLVGSTELPPLPTVLIAVIGLLPFVDPSLLASSVVSALAAVLLAVYMNRLWAAEGISPWVRYVGMACLLSLPPVALSVQLGQSTMLFIALVVCGWGLLTQWLRDGALRNLAYSAILLGLAVAVRYQAVLIVFGAILVVTCAVLLAHRRLSVLEGTVLTFVVPTGYVVLLWLCGNWLILGNPLFFLRGVAHSVAIGTADLQTVLISNCKWALLAVVGLMVLLVPLMSAASRRPSGGALRHAAALVGIVAAVALTVWGDVSVEGARSRPDIPHVVRTLRQRYPNSTFIVMGYEGYDFMEAAGENSERGWVHLMHLPPSAVDKVLDDFIGRTVYLLVHSRRTMERWDDLGLEWRRGQGRIPERLLFVEDLDPWVLFECLRPEMASSAGV